MITSATSGTTGTTGTTGTGTTSDASAFANAAGGSLGKDAFLKLLVAQMKNQDPLSPMQGDQMAAQLAQFSSVEQLTQINQTLAGQHTDQSTLLNAIQTSSAMGAIGHTVQSVGNSIEIGNGVAPEVKVHIALAGRGTLTIYDANGDPVGSRDLGVVNGGDQTIQLGDAANGLSDGAYTYGVSVKDANGKDVDVTTYMTGKVDGVQQTTSGVVLTAGRLTIPYSSVVQIFK